MDGARTQSRADLGDRQRVEVGRRLSPASAQQRAIVREIAFKLAHKGGRKAASKRRLFFISSPSMRIDQMLPVRTRWLRIMSAAKF